MTGNAIIDQEEFHFEGTDYIARLYHPNGKSIVYGEIVYKRTLSAHIKKCATSRGSI